MSDIRKWFMKQHGNNKGTSAGANKPTNPSSIDSGKMAQGFQENTVRRKTSKYFETSPPASAQEVTSKQGEKEEGTRRMTPAKRKSQKISEEPQNDLKPAVVVKHHKEDDDNDFMLPTGKKKSTDAKQPPKKMKRDIVKWENDEDESADMDVESPVKPSGRGKGGRGSAEASGGRGRGGGRGGFMNFGERKDPPHKGEKEVPEGLPDCFAGLTFVISGTLDSLEREEAEDLIKRHGGRVTGSVSKKTNFLLVDEDIGGRKSQKAKELGTPFLTEDELFDMIRKSKPAKVEAKGGPKKKTPEKMDKSQVKHSPKKVELNDAQVGSVGQKGVAKTVQSRSPLEQNGKASTRFSLTWTEKYKPKVPNDIIGNQSLIKQLHDWLHHWNEQFLQSGPKGKGKNKQNASTSKKAVLISGSPGIGKSTSAKLVSLMLGFEVIEVNASDSRGKADSKISKGIGGSTSNSIKELVNNESMTYSKDGSKHRKSVLIMDEVDGMSAGDRGGVADLIASIKMSKIPIICICNDRYSQKLKSLVNYCMPLNYRKPTKQQMAKRLKQIADSEGLQVNEVALEELADRVNGDMRMALNQLQYMSLSMSLIKYDDIRARLLSSAKDEDISPFTAVDKLFGFNGGKLRMDERIDLTMSDPDLIPLIVQENYINYRPSSIGKDDTGVKRMNQIARAAESIGDGDIFNVQIRRYRQWQLSQAGSFASSIIPAALLHGNRETLEPGERNFNRFGGWLGKNSTTAKNLRLLEDVHVHILASQESNMDRDTLRIDYFSLLLKQLTEPLRVLSKEEAVQKVLEFMDAYSLSQEDFDTVMDLSKFQGHPNPMDGIPAAVKAALTKAYKQGSSNRVVRAADLVPLPGMKKAPKKRIAAMLEPELMEDASPEEGDRNRENEESSEAEENNEDESETPNDSKPQLDLHTDKSKGIQVQLDLKSDKKSKKTKMAPENKTGGTEAAAGRGRGRGAGGGKRKR